MKQHYWDTLLRNLADEDNIIALWEKMMVLDAIYGVSQASSSANAVMLVRS
jgi:hypothetical protein